MCLTCCRSLGNQNSLIQSGLGHEVSRGRREKKLSYPANDVTTTNMHIQDGGQHAASSRNISETKQDRKQL